MHESRAPVPTFPGYLAERRARLADRLAGRVTPTEAMHAIRELLDELLTLDLSQRSTRERQVGERALRIIRDAAGLLLAVRASAQWSQPASAMPRRPRLPWRLLGLVAVQLVVGIGLAMLLSGALQRGTAGGDGSLALALVLAAGLVVLQLLTGYQLVARTRARQALPSTADSRPDIVLSVDGDTLMSSLGQALVAADGLERLAAAPPEQAAPTRPGLAEYPELLRAVQQVYAARSSDDPQRARRRAEALRASLEQYGVALHDEWDRREPPPPDLFVTQRSLDPSASTYRVILPAVTDASGVILPGRIAVPAAGTEPGPARAGRTLNGEEAPL
jgi:uncharacterized membrane protein YidH (DUF202 family)